MRDTPKKPEFVFVPGAWHSPESTFDSPVTTESWRHIPSTFIVCEEDKAILVEAQLGMIRGAQEIAEGSFGTIERKNAGHSPFISQPEWLAEKLIKAAGNPI
ncbi:hypothetical protein EAF00_011191 [Botryotinia globosa]|nr:hypothetical protein EAF00_011191 [Botryotinia globosa]